MVRTGPPLPVEVKVDGEVSQRPLDSNMEEFTSQVQFTLEVYILAKCCTF